MDNRLLAAYAYGRLRHPEHPGLTRREYMLDRVATRRRIRWLVAMLGAGALLAAGWCW